MDRDFIERVRAATALLEEIRDDRTVLARLSQLERRRLLTAAGQIAKPDPWARREMVRALRRRRRDRRKQADTALLDATGIRVKRLDPIYVTPRLEEGASRCESPSPPGPEPASLQKTRVCYVCKAEFQRLHHFYDSMCPSCAELNWHKRNQTCDLSGRVALVTGARVKIGYQAAIKLLRAGARVIASTRFPRDATARYAREPDFAEWSDRLEIHGIDLRHTPSVERFCEHLVDTHDRLDFILNNACQTIRRPAAFYAHLLESERIPTAQLPAGHRSVLGPQHSAPSASLLPAALLSDELFPAGRLDADLQQIDLRPLNSWRLGLAEVSAVELLEVHLVNAVAPFIINARLKPLMLRVPTRDKHIVNVSAMEGQFYRKHKTDRHPHTNMAKASLNMMTRTSAADYIEDGIHMNSVDTGWVTDEDPAELARRKTEVHGFHPPLDIVDGAARICDPIFTGFLTGEHVWGMFLKDYAPAPW